MVDPVAPIPRTLAIFITRRGIVRATCKVKDDVFVLTASYPEIEPIPGVRTQAQMIPVLAEFDGSVQTSALEMRVNGDCSTIRVPGVEPPGHVMIR